MRIEGITAEIRPRNAWEAIDLGCVLTRRHYGAILRAWCATVLPLWLLILVTMREHVLWAMAVIWWLKPVAERVPLFVLSRALFGEPVRWQELWREWPRMIGRRVGSTLVWRRFSPVRSLVAPVADMERREGRLLRGREFRDRKHAVSVGAGTAAFWMQIAALAVLHCSWTGLLLFAYLMVPARHQPDLLVLWDTWGEPGAVAPAAMTWVGAVLYLACLTLVAPFYVGGGFGLYLNSRTRLEGWDVELAFRRMGKRLARSGVAAALALGVGLWLLSGPAVQAGEADAAVAGQSPAETIAQVLKDPDFEVQKFKIYRLKKREAEDLPSLHFPRVHIPAFEGLGGKLTWLILVPLGLAVVYVLARALLLRLGNAGRPAVRSRPRVRTVAGLNVEEEKLPRDLIGVARGLWQTGDLTGATRLLYRGAVSWLIHQGGVPIRESDTEVDCLRRVRAQRRREADYFADLTRIWILTAYGGKNGSGESISGLLDGWPFAAASDREKA